MRFDSLNVLKDLLMQEDHSGSRFFITITNKYTEEKKVLDCSFITTEIVDELISAMEMSRDYEAIKRLIIED